MRVAILGAGGPLAPAIVRDLAGSAEFGDLTLLDRDGAAARAVAEEHGGPSATGAAVEALDRQALTLAIEGHMLLVNAAGPSVSLAAMDAALASRCNYLDLGGDPDVTVQQLRFDEAFTSAGLVAIVGCGSAPGKTNVMAARAARGLDTIEEIRCASTDDSEAAAAEGLEDGGDVDFPHPVGRRPTLQAPSAEVLTLPRSLGARRCDFRRADAEPRAWSAQHVEVTGTRDGAAETVTVTAVTGPDEASEVSGGVISAAAMASSTARLLARGALGALAGVLPPERALDADALFPELEQRGCTFTISRREAVAS